MPIPEPHPHFAGLDLKLDITELTETQRDDLNLLLERMRTYDLGLVYPDLEDAGHELLKPAAERTDTRTVIDRAITAWALETVWTDVDRTRPHTSGTLLAAARMTALAYVDDLWREQPDTLPVRAAMQAALRQRKQHFVRELQHLITKVRHGGDPDGALQEATIDALLDTRRGLISGTARGGDV